MSSVVTIYKVVFG